MVNLKHFSSFLLYLCAFLIVHNEATTEFVPVFMWENANLNAMVPAVGHVNQATFMELLLETVKNSNSKIVVFAEPTLSPEDFTVRNTKIFQYLTEIGDQHKSTYIPSVETPIYVTEQLPSSEPIIIKSIEELDLENLPKSQILIINLNDANDNEDRLDMLKRHDSMIYKIYQKLTENSETVLGIFTGEQSSWVAPNSFKQRKARAAGDPVPEAKGIYKHSQNFGVYVSGKMNLVLNDKPPKELELLSIEQTENLITLKTDDDDIVMEYINNQADGYWYIINIVCSTINTTTNIYAPSRNFSYHCSNQTFFSNSDMLSIPSFQIQYFAEAKDENRPFGDAYDCVGFTSAPIWSGLFVTFILVLIMTAGLTMMLDIKTMDRFDDPKGKTIIINASE